MITFLDSLSWLNEFEASHLRRTTQALMRHIRDLQTPEDNRTQMITSAIKNSRNHADPMELPELLLQIAEARYRQGNFSSARDHASAAIQLYPDGSHYMAVARWILGMITWKLGEYKLAYSSWYYARENFEQLADEADRLDRIERKEWYQERLLEINVEMVCTPEEIYTWLDIFEPSHLSRAAQQLNNTVIEKLEKNQFQDVYRLIEDMQTLGRNSSDHIEEAEILVECALAVYRMGNINEATRLLQTAVNRFNPDSHHQAVTRWLLGIFYWETPGKNNQAIINWETALEDFSALARKSDTQNRQKRLAWYHSRRNIMAVALKEKIKEKLAS